MIDLYLGPGSYRVTRGPVTLYSGLSSGSLTLIGTWPANGSKLSIVASAITGHVDCSGMVTINGSETITFTQAGRKTSTVSLSALPTIVTANLDCNLVITVLDSGLAPILAETLTAIDTRIESFSSGFYNAQGVWTKTNTMIISKVELQINDTVRKGTKNYIIADSEDNPDLGQESDFYTYKAN